MNNFKLLRGYDINPNERRIYNIDVGNINSNDVEYFMERLRASLRVPMNYFRTHMLNEPDIFIPVRNTDNEYTDIHR